MEIKMEYIVCPECSNEIKYEYMVLFAGSQLICNECGCKWIVELLLNYDPKKESIVISKEDRVNLQGYA
jgi:uncharacterized Zn finger protein